MKRLIATAGAAVIMLGAGIVAGSSLAGGNDERPVAEPVLAKPLVAAKGPGAKTLLARQSGKSGPEIRFFYARSATVPDEGASIVQPIRCPRGQGEPIGGGAQTTDGISLVYLSRVNPRNGETPARTYYVGVEDSSSENTPGSGATVEVQCATGLKVVPSG